MQEKYRKPQINAAGLVARYKLWAGFYSAVSLFDYSLNGYVATATLATPAYPGFTFDGASKFIGIVTGPAGVKTLLAWVKPTGVAGTDTVIDLNGTDFLTISTGTLTKNGFAGGTTVLYVDGIAGTTVTANWHLVGITDTVGKDMALSTIGLEGTTYFTGLIGETMCFDRVLSAADWKSIYELTKWRYAA